MYYEHGSVFPEYDKLQELVERRLVSKRTHPQYSLDIYNYTQDAQTAWMWKFEPVLLSARGLVLDGNRVVAQGLRKFFNHGDTTGGQEPEGKVVITDKLDGSMILSFLWGGEVVTATRGTFDSDQAKLAKKLITNTHAPGDTYIWELIGPSNRHVVDYPVDQCVCLGLVTASGADVGRKILESFAQGYDFPLVTKHDLLLDDIVKMDANNAEGYVYSIEEGFRVAFRSKVKFPTYLAAHKVISREKWYTAVYDAWVAGEIEPLMDILPEFYKIDVQGYVNKLNERQDYVNSEVSSLVSTCLRSGKDPNDKAQRKEMAFTINRHNDSEVRTAAFTALSGRKYTIKELAR